MLLHLTTVGAATAHILLQQVLLQLTTVGVATAHPTALVAATSRYSNVAASNSEVHERCANDP